MVDDEPADDVLAALGRAAPYFDTGWNVEQGVSPSLICRMRYCMLMTRDEEARDAARELASRWLRVGRQRWRDGFSANPLTAEPMPRT